jgi:opacity protein-like surface antigen
MSKRALSNLWRGSTFIVALTASATAGASPQSQPANEAGGSPESEQAQPAQAQPSEGIQQQESLPMCPPGEANLPNCPPAMTPPPPMAAAPQKHKRHHNIVFAPSEVSLVTGAGPTNYFGTGFSASKTDVGALWDARAVFGAHSILAMEAGYVGSINSVDSTMGHGQISSQGLDTDLRLQLPWKVQPYVFGGVGYNHMALNNFNGSTEITSQFIKGDDNQFTVPAGGGLTGYVGHLTLDLRGTYRYTPDNDITIINSHAIHQWYAQARVGYTF